MKGKLDMGRDSMNGQSGSGGQAYRGVGLNEEVFNVEVVKLNTEEKSWASRSYIGDPVCENRSASLNLGTDTARSGLTVSKTAMITKLVDIMNGTSVIEHRRMMTPTAVETGGLNIWRKTR